MAHHNAFHYSLSTDIGWFHFILQLQRKVEISQPQPSHSVIFKLFIQAISLVELIDTSASLSSFLLSCIERMTFGADFYVDILLGRSCYKSITAVAGYSCLIVIRMDSFSHDFHLSIFILFYLRWIWRIHTLHSLLIIAWRYEKCKLFIKISKTNPR